MNECIIGIWYDYDETDIITLNDLKDKMSDIKSMNEYKKENGFDKIMPLAKEYTIEDYFNKRKNCDNFSLFDYCPHCGKKIELAKKEGK